MKNLLLAIFLLASLLPASAYTDIECGVRVFLTPDPAGMVDGPDLYTYVKQNPWTYFDPEGLDANDSNGPRKDPDGFKWSSDNHHTVPASVARDAGWSPEAKAVFDSDEAKVKTPNGHDFTKHGKYNAEVSAEMADFFKEKGITNIGSKSAKEQVELAHEFVDKIANTDNAFIKGFNAAAANGSGAVDDWYYKSGKNIVMKSTGMAANAEGAKIMTGISKVAKVGGKFMKGMPIIAGALVVGSDMAQGKTNDEVGRDVIMSVTNADIAQWALTENPITQAGLKPINHWNQQIEDVNRQVDEVSGPPVPASK